MDKTLTFPTSSLVCFVLSNVVFMTQIIHASCGDYDNDHNPFSNPVLVLSETLKSHRYSNAEVCRRGQHASLCFFAVLTTLVVSFLFAGMLGRGPCSRLWVPSLYSLRQSLHKYDGAANMCEDR